MDYFDQSQYQATLERTQESPLAKALSHDIVAQLGEFIEQYRRVPRYASYHFVNPSAATTIARLNEEGGQPLVAYFLKRVLLDAIDALGGRLEQEALPDSIREMYPRNIERILQSIPANPDETFSLENDRFVKDLCICTLRMYPAGGRLLEPYCGLPRRLIFQGGISGVPRVLRRLIQLGGVAPLVQFHTHTSDLADFNPEGMRRTYHRVADLLESRIELLGLYTASWFNDPKVSTISPRLAYLRELPVLNGAFLVPGIVDDNSTASAISRSPTRRKLFESGQYQPRIYYLIWPRRELIDWSKRGHTN